MNFFRIVLPWFFFYRHAAEALGGKVGLLQGQSQDAATPGKAGKSVPSLSRGRDKWACQQPQLGQRQIEPPDLEQNFFPPTSLQAVARWTRVRLHSAKRQREFPLKYADNLAPQAPLESSEGFWAPVLLYSKICPQEAVKSPRRALFVQPETQSLLLVHFCPSNSNLKCSFWKPYNIANCLRWTSSMFRAYASKQTIIFCCILGALPAWWLWQIEKGANP